MTHGLIFEDIFRALESKESAIGVVGLGYVGLPLAALFANKFRVIGFDINAIRIAQLRDGIDVTGEVEKLKAIPEDSMEYTHDPSMLKKCSVIIVTVPTPVDEHKVPDLTPLGSASEIVGRNLSRSAVVIFESTVFPGVTEDFCAPILEAESRMICGEDFHLGYSPERVNPGDKSRTIDKITKIVAGQSNAVTELLASLYGSVISAGIHKAPNIKTAEAAKAVENAQRDLNIAFVNELAMLFDNIGIDTLDVIEAASTKWNFLPFRPGLVGGHCIGVDPFYLSHLAAKMDFHTESILTARRINDSISKFVGSKCLNMILNAARPANGKLKVAILGMTFKENIPDTRNSKVIELANFLEKSGANVFCIDPIADADEFQAHFKKSLVSWETLPQCDAIILAVQHDIFLEQYPVSRMVEKLTDNRIILDVKGRLDRREAEANGVTLWRL